MSTVGDLGYVDEEGFIHLIDPKSFMIFSGANIYPQKCENLLATHPKMRIKARWIAFCREHLAHMKCPRSIDFEDDSPVFRRASSTRRLFAIVTGRATRAEFCETHCI